MTLRPEIYYSLAALPTTSGPETAAGRLRIPHLVLVSLAERLKLSLADDGEDAGDVEANNLAAGAKVGDDKTFISWQPRKRNAPKLKAQCTCMCGSPYSCTRIMQNRSAHLGKLVRGATGDLGHAETGKLGLEVLELREGAFSVRNKRLGSIESP